jgi:hypothetical protein
LLDSSHEKIAMSAGLAVAQALSPANRLFSFTG